MGDERRTILVTGATGAQGGSVARELLRRGEFRVRALTRTPSVAEAVALRGLGAEIVRGDLFDIDSVRAAMDGVHGVFGVTSYWEHFEREAELGDHLVEAAADARVEHLVLSTLPAVKELTGGELDVPHFDIKAATRARAEAEGIPLTAVQLAFRYDNLTTFFTPQLQQDGSYVFGFPQGDTKLPGFAVEDTGALVAPLFERPDEYIGRELNFVGDDLRAEEYADIMSRVTNAIIRYRHVPREVFAGYGFRGAGPLADEFEYYRTWAPDRDADLQQCRALHRGLQTFETWARRHLRRIEQALAA